MTNLMPGIANLIADPNGSCLEVNTTNLRYGLDVSVLKKGTMLKVRTWNTEYLVYLKGDRDVIVCGGEYFPRPTHAFFNGSTWGGSMMKLDWIGYGMGMEFIEKTKDGLKTVLTSGVQAVKIMQDDGISFLHEWGTLASSA